MRSDVNIQSSANDVTEALQQRRSNDNLSVELDEVTVPTLTDVLLKVCRKTLERNRTMLNTNQDIRSVTLTIRLSEVGEPYKVLLVPSHESDGR